MRHRPTVLVGPDRDRLPQRGPGRTAQRPGDAGAGEGVPPNDDDVGEGGVLGTAPDPDLPDPERRGQGLCRRLELGHMGPEGHLDQQVVAEGC